MMKKSVYMRVSRCRGSRHVRAELGEDEVRTIWRRLRAPRGRGDRPTSLAREFGVSASLIYGIGAGRNWGWLTRMMGMMDVSRETRSAR
jgi:hypothetical protein